jgi:hypothetical protein
MELKEQKPNIEGIQEILDTCPPEIIKERGENFFCSNDCVMCIMPRLINYLKPFLNQAGYVQVQAGEDGLARIPTPEGNDGKEYDWYSEGFDEGRTRQKALDGNRAKQEKRELVEKIFEGMDTFCLNGKKHGRGTNLANIRKRECRQCFREITKGYVDE